MRDVFLMGWLRRREPDYAALDAMASVILDTEDKGAILDKAPNDAHRYHLCVQWAEQARNDFYAGRRETIAAVVASRDGKYRQYPAEVRVAIGEQIWAKSAKAKDFIGLEQMYARWAVMYSSQVA